MHPSLYSWVPLVSLPAALLPLEPILIYKNHSTVSRVTLKQEGCSQRNGRVKEEECIENVPERDDRQITNSENL